MFRIAIVSLLIVFTIFGCKTKQKAAKYSSPHTDTIKVVVNYQPDSLELFVKKIIVSDSLFISNDGILDYNILHVEQKDSLMLVTIQSQNGCSVMDFDLYQSPFAFKTYPVRLRCRVSKTKQDDCVDEPFLKAFTLAFDIRPMLSEYTEANIMFTGYSNIVSLKRQ